MTSTQNCLDASPSHLTAAECHKLLPAAPTGEIAAGHRFIGPCSVYWFCDDVTARAHIMIAEEVDTSWQLQWPGLSALVNAAAEHGCTMLLIDADADTVAGLTCFD